VGSTICAPHVSAPGEIPDLDFSGSGDGAVWSFVLEPDLCRAASPLVFSPALGSFPCRMKLWSWWLRRCCLDVPGWPRLALPFDYGGGTPVSSPQSRLSDALRLCLVSAAQRPSASPTAHRCRRTDSAIRRPSIVPVTILGVLLSGLHVFHYLFLGLLAFGVEVLTGDPPRLST
jgi:hypothetical protein